MIFRRFIAACLGLSLAAAHAQQLPELGDTSQAVFTPQMEKRIGELAMREIRRDPAYVNDPEVTRYVKSLGARLAAVSPGAGEKFTFFVVRDPTVNAFAMPGGYIGIHSGLITTSQSESELASVVAHEIAHITQRHIARSIEKQQQIQPLAIAALLLAIAAARSSPQAATAAVMGAQAGAVQAQLNYSRDFEREADRIGFQILQQSGFDVSGMPSFFERLQKATRLYENNAPAYLRTHPLNTERIADMQGRADGVPYQQKEDSLDYRLVRAKLRAEQGDPRGTMIELDAQLKERRFPDQTAARYALAHALVRARDFKRAEAEVAGLRASGLQHPMLETLAAEVARGLGRTADAQAILAAAHKQYPDNVAVTLAYARTLQETGRHTEVVGLLDDLMRTDPGNVLAYEMQAKSYAALGKRTQQHRVLAELYYLQGSIPAAVEQLRLAQLAGDADFFTLSAIDARLRALRAEQLEEAKEKQSMR